MTMFKPLGAAASFALLMFVSAAPAAAQLGTDASDGRCFAALSTAQDNAAKSDKDSFDAAMMYYMGKIVGRGGTRALAPALGAGAAVITAKNADKVAIACAGEMERVGNAM